MPEIDVCVKQIAPSLTIGGTRHLTIQDIRHSQ